MQIGVISDTHSRTLGNIPEPILTKLAEVDLIIHAGDFTEEAVLEGLQTLGKVKAVCGNMDSSEIRRMLPAREIFTANGKRIGVAHGSGGPWGIAERMRQMFDEVDIIIYGHSHKPDIKIIGGSLLFNPGAARKSFGLITIEKEIEPEIITI